MIEYRVADEATAEEQVLLYNNVFAADAKLEKWKKKHYGNPISGTPLLHGAFDGDKLVGINGFIRMDYDFKGQMLRVVQSCDSAVDPQYRGKGIFTGIINDALEDFRKAGYDAVVGFTNQNSHPAFMKMKWNDVLHTSKLFLPANIPPVLLHMKGVHVPSIANIANVFLWWRIRHYSKVKSDLQMIKTHTFNTEDYHKFVNTDCIVFNADDSMLKWKLEDLVGYYCAKEKGVDVASFVVTQYAYKDGMRRANIILTDGKESNKQAYLVALAKVMLELKRDFDLICLWEPYENYKKEAVKKLGFLGNVVTQDGSPFILKILTDDAKKIEILQNTANWRPTQLETDTMISLDR